MAEKLTSRATNSDQKCPSFKQAVWIVFKSTGLSVQESYKEHETDSEAINWTIICWPERVKHIFV